MIRHHGQADWTLDRHLRYDELEEVLRRFHPGGRLLEVGAGAGGLLVRGGTPSVTTLDLDEATAPMVLADATVLPFAAGTFEVTVCIDVIEHLPPHMRRRLMTELTRVTNGILVIGAPFGAASERADRRLLLKDEERRRPSPTWLREHIASAPFPTRDDIVAGVGVAPLHEVKGMSLGAHRALSRARHRRGLTRIEMLVATRVRFLARRLLHLGSPYRRLLVFDLSPPLFSVVMATRNRVDRLEIAATSVLAQTVRSLELLLIDDASADATPTMSDRLLATDPRVRVIRRETASGSCAAARNTALDSCRGRYLAFCDDDVLWRPDHLAKCVAALAHSDACATQAQRFLPDGRPYDVVGRDWGRAFPKAGDVDANCMAVARHLMISFPDGRGRYGSEDIRLVRRLHRQGIHFSHVPSVTVDYTFNMQSHCYTYQILPSTDGGSVVTSQPKVVGWRGRQGRVIEAVSVRVKRILYKNA